MEWEQGSRSKHGKFGDKESSLLCQSPKFTAENRSKETGM